jgi:hypothetical protein
MLVVDLQNDFGGNGNRFELAGIDISMRRCTKSPLWTSSLCNLGVLCASVVKELLQKNNHRYAQRLHKEIRLLCRASR